MSRNWNILNWNVRGINSQTRWDDIRAKIDESNCVSFAFKKQRETHLINLTSEIFPLGDITNLLIHHQ